MKKAVQDEKHVCPVCGKELGDHVPDMESVLAELSYNDKDIRIMTEEVVIEVDFDHVLDEEGFSLDEPHPLVAVIKIRFDRTGKGISYEVLQIFEGVDNG